MFETVLATVTFSRRLFGRSGHSAYIEQVLRDLSLWDKRDAKIMELSGGMKRRVLIAKALAHEPEILFLDEPTAGVDVALRRDMWKLVHGLRERGTTIILTTHYIEEAEEIADRVGVINAGELLLIEDKTTLMKKLGAKQLRLELTHPLEAVPPGLEAFDLKLVDDGRALVHDYAADETHGNGHESRIAALMKALSAADVPIGDISTHQSSLEDIFVKLIGERA